MDKYTVDLDKVLNDFEYSELTEHNNIGQETKAIDATVSRFPYITPPVNNDSFPFNPFPLQSKATTEETRRQETIAKSPVVPIYTNETKEIVNESVVTEQEANATDSALPRFTKQNSNDSNRSACDVTTELELSCHSNHSTSGNASELSTTKIGQESNACYTLPVDVITEQAQESNAMLPRFPYSSLTSNSSSKLVTTSGKNSINNVFHSLNEYLNTDITTTECKSNDSKIQQDLIEPVIVRKVPTTELGTIQEIFDTISKRDVDVDKEKIIKRDLDVDIKEQNVEDLNTTTFEPPEIVEIHPVGFDPLDLSDTEVENELTQLEHEYNTLDLERNEKTALEDTVIPNTNETEDVTGDVGAEARLDGGGEETSGADDRPKLLRPNSLDLNGDSITINLIGDPGSTPYNNVYTDTNFDNVTPVPTELEPTDAANNSLSSTISDASTYENSDSPNTSDSCNDTSIEEQAAIETNALNETVEERGELRDVPGVMNGVDNDCDVTSQASWLGKTAPFWTPDSDALNCLHCNQKFTLIRRRHHCRACGLVLCSKCCNMKYKLEFMDNSEAKVCLKCYNIFTKDIPEAASGAATANSDSDNSLEAKTSNAAGQSAKYNPNNPMEYCSTIPPHEQVANLPTQPPSVMVPVGVLKRKGSGKSRSSKSVMFCDGIRPGCDLTELDNNFSYRDTQSGTGSSISSTSTDQPKQLRNATSRSNRNLPSLDPQTASFIPADQNSLPPIVTNVKSNLFYAECLNNNSCVELLRKEVVTFALQRNLHVQVKIINMDCCINKEAWCFTTDGMITVGQDEIIIILEVIENEKTVPKDVFLHLSSIYNDAVKGASITELGISIHQTGTSFLESKNHAGFLYVKPTFQCIQNVILPKEPYLIGVLIHRWETPWAKIFPLRLLLRLGAQYRYYPSPIISTRHRESVYVEVGHTIINLLADFRNFSYTIPNVRGLTIHMEDKNTTVSIPRNRYDQVMKALNNSSDHILAFAANFSPAVDSHLVCIQDTDGNNENAYTTHAINILNKPRQVTGASFIVLNGALKSTSGLTAKSSIVEDGLMVQILPEHMVKLRDSLRNMKDFKISCGCVNVQSDECVNIQWTENDVAFNIGVVSPIDNLSLSGVPSIRVHNGRDYVCNSGSKMIRWTEVFIIESGEECARNRNQDPVDVSKLAESISKATSQALVKYLDLLATNCCTKIGIRTTLHVENVSYVAGSNSTKLPPIYMKSLDNELIPVLHRITANNFGEQTIVLELLFHILNI